MLKFHVQIIFHFSLRRSQIRPIQTINRFEILFPGSKIFYKVEELFFKKNIKEDKIIVKFMN